jgi:hypothetical protein
MVKPWLNQHFPTMKIFMKPPKKGGSLVRARLSRLPLGRLASRGGDMGWDPGRATGGFIYLWL